LEKINRTQINFIRKRSFGKPGLLLFFKEYWQQTTNPYLAIYFIHHLNNETLCTCLKGKLLLVLLLDGKNVFNTTFE